MAYVDIAAAGDAETVARQLGRFGAGVPELAGDSWEVALTQTARAWVGDDDPALADGYPVVVEVYSTVSDEATEAAAKDLFYQLAARTDWGLRLLDIEASTVATRPARRAG